LAEWCSGADPGGGGGDYEVGVLICRGGDVDLICRGLINYSRKLPRTQENCSHPVSLTRQSRTNAHR